MLSSRLNTETVLTRSNLAVNIATLVQLFLPLTGTGQVISGLSGVDDEYCEDETFSPTCPDDQAILMKYARYGRMNLGGCIETGFGKMGCETDKLRHMDDACSGRDHCEVKVSDLLGQDNPCKKDLRNYLKAGFECVQVYNFSPCASYPIQVSAQSGAFSSYVTRDTRCGSPQAPWRVVVKPGQTINIILYDLNGPTIETCKVLAVISEPNRETISRTTTCSSARRMELIYTSASNIVEIRMQNTADHLYLLKYEAVGCPNLSLDEQSTFLRTPHGAIIRCQDNRKWTLTCNKDKTWSGSYNNCSTGVSIALIAAVALVIGVTILVFGLVHLRRRRRMQHDYNRRLPVQMNQNEKNDNADFYSHHLGTYQQSPRDFSPDTPPYGLCRGENTYYRTWETKSHFQVQGLSMTPITGVIGAHGGHLQHTTATNYPKPITPEDESDRYVEHIYESPKSLRRETGREPLQYYELESKDNSSKFSAAQKLK